MASSALLFYGGWRVLDGALTVGDLMMFLVYLLMLLGGVLVSANIFGWHWRSVFAVNIPIAAAALTAAAVLVPETRQARAQRLGGRRRHGRKTNRLTMQRDSFFARVVYTRSLAGFAGQPVESASAPPCGLCALFVPELCASVTLWSLYVIGIAAGR